MSCKAATRKEHAEDVCDRGKRCWLCGLCAYHCDCPRCGTCAKVLPLEAEGMFCGPTCEARVE